MDWHLFFLGIDTSIAYEKTLVNDSFEQYGHSTGTDFIAFGDKATGNCKVNRIETKRHYPSHLF